MSNTAVYRLTSIFLAFISVFCYVFGGVTVPHGEKLDLGRFELFWSEEFDGDRLDETKWSGHYVKDGQTKVRKGGYWNKELASVSDGCLRVSTKYLENGVDGNGPSGWYSYALDTKNHYEQTYGYFETRCILPKGSGLWSAFWILCDSMTDATNGGINGAEIDVFESCFYSLKNGKFKNSVSSTIHIDGYDEAHKAKNVCNSLVYASNPYEEFNTYGVEWNESEYIFYINGIEAGRNDFGGASQVPEYLILSVEVGGENGKPEESWVGESIETAGNEITDFVVDYVRAYQYK